MAGVMAPAPVAAGSWRGYEGPIDNPDPDRAREDFGCDVKRCSRCREWLPADVEFFPRASSAKTGLHSWCKACWADRVADR